MFWCGGWNPSAHYVTCKGNRDRFCQPSPDEHGNLITSTEQQLESWAVFFENKFSAQPNEAMPDIAARLEEDSPPPGLLIEETKT